MIDEPIPTGSMDSGGGLIGGLIALGGSIYEAEVSKKNVDKTIAANKEQSQYAYSKDLEMWNRQNDYNSPFNQMARLKSAGLNPNMVYGSGTAAGNTSGQMPKYNAPTLQYNYKPVVDLPRVLGLYQDFQMRQAQIDNVKANTKNTVMRTFNENLRSSIMDTQGARGKFDLNMAKVLGPYVQEIKGMEAQTSGTKWNQELEKLKLLQMESGEGRQLQYDQRKADLVFKKYRNDFIKMGVTTSDNIVVRMLAKMLDEVGLPEINLNQDKIQRDLHLK